MVGGDYFFCRTLSSVPAISLFIFSRWRVITNTGIIVAAMSKGHKSANCQCELNIMARTSEIGKMTAPIIEASDIYRVIRTTAAHIIKVKAAQIE